MHGGSLRALLYLSQGFARSPVQNADLSSHCVEAKFDNRLSEPVADCIIIIIIIIIIGVPFGPTLGPTLGPAPLPRLLQRHPQQKLNVLNDAQSRGTTVPNPKTNAREHPLRARSRDPVAPDSTLVGRLEEQALVE